MSVESIHQVVEDLYHISVGNGLTPMETVEVMMAEVMRLTFATRPTRAEATILIHHVLNQVIAEAFDSVEGAAKQPFSMK